MSENKKLTPKIRFKGFTEDWEQRKVEELFKITRGYVLSATLTSESKDNKNKYPVYSSMQNRTPSKALCKRLNVMKKELIAKGVNVIT